MNILLTNDDGIHSEGINSLYAALSREHAVFIIAPDSERSACSNAITVRTPLKIKKASDNKYSISGFPADCVIIGLSGNLIPDVDLVISGINHGPNVGDDLIFSGTVAGARTAYVFGKAAIAMSINAYHRASHYLDDASEFIAGFIKEQAPAISASSAIGATAGGLHASSRPFFNINYPDLPAADIKGKKYTHVGRRIYRDSFKETSLDGGEALVQMGGYIESIFAEGSDTTELENGYISITPMMIDTTDYTSLKKYFR
jgi:5'-nucleotidase